MSSRTPVLSHPEGREDDARQRVALDRVAKLAPARRLAGLDRAVPVAVDPRQTIDQEQRGNAERRAIFVGLWPPMLWLIGNALQQHE